MGNFIALFKRLSGLNWLAIVLSIVFVLGVYISLKKQSTHERNLLFDKQNETARLRDSLRTVIRRHNIDSINYYRLQYTAQRHENELLQIKLKSDYAKHRNSYDSIKRVLGPRPRF